MGDLLIECLLGLLNERLWIDCDSDEIFENLFVLWLEKAEWERKYS